MKVANESREQLASRLSHDSLKYTTNRMTTAEFWTAAKRLPCGKLEAIISYLRQIHLHDHQRLSRIHTEKPCHHIRRIHHKKRDWWGGRSASAKPMEAPQEQSPMESMGQISKCDIQAKFKCLNRILNVKYDNRPHFDCQNRLLRVKMQYSGQIRMSK